MALKGYGDKSQVKYEESNITKYMQLVLQSFDPCCFLYHVQAKRQGLHIGALISTMLMINVVGKRQADELDVNYENAAKELARMNKNSRSILFTWTT